MPLDKPFQISRHIFREYDIRGLVNKDLFESVYESIGIAFGNWLKTNLQKETPIITTGRDVRLQSFSYQKAFIEGLLKAGCRAKDLGMVPTPVVYYSQITSNSDACAVITASHNPPEYNGLKLKTKDFPLYGKYIKQLYDMIKGGDGENSNNKMYFTLSEKSFVIKENIIPQYVDYICNTVKLKKRVKVVVDGGNGSAGELATMIYEKMGAEVIPLYTNPDGNFPNHISDPTVEKYMTDLKNAVLKHNADIGIGLDGDGDRIGIVDETGVHWAGDRLLQLFALNVLKKASSTYLPSDGEYISYNNSKNPAVVFDVKCSDSLSSEIANNNGIPVMWKTGYPFMTSKIKETNAILGGEMSGHIYFADRYYGFDDGVYAGARILELISELDVPVSFSLPKAKTVSTPEIHIPTSEDCKFELTPKIQGYFESKYPIETIDGIRIKFPKGWALIRASNTQPVLVTRFEADNEECMLSYINEVEEAFYLNCNMKVDIRHLMESSH